MGKYDGMLLVADFDNTLRPYGEETVPQENLDAAEEFMAEGGLFTIATGRNPRSFLSIRHLFRVNAPVILNNGGVIFDPESGEDIYESFLPFSCRDDLRALLEHFPGTGAEIHRGVDIRVCARNDGVTEHLRQMGAEVYPAPMERVMFPWSALAVIAPGELDEENETAHRIAEWIHASWPGRYEAVCSKAIVDITAPGSDKGTGVLRLAQLLDVEPEHLVCIGDGWNDISMLRAAGRAFVPAEAPEEIKCEPGITVLGSCRSCLREALSLL